MFYGFEEKIIGQNTLQDFLYAFAIFIALVLVFHTLQVFLLWRIKKLVKSTENDIDDTALEIFESLKPPIYTTIALFISIKFLVLSQFVDKLSNIAIIILIVYQIVNSIQILVDYILRKYLLSDGDESSKSAFKILTTFSKIILWILGLLVILQNVGVNVTSVIAGMGIGGVAIAFALKEILSDLFSSFAIIFDKPFKEGDFIVVGEHMGTVKKIGIKTTRIQSLQGEEIVFSNQKLTADTIQNFKKMEERRVMFRIGVSYATSQKSLAKIPQIIEDIIKSIKLLRFDRSNLYKLSESSVDFETVYYLKTDDYNQYMKIQEKINIEIINRFRKENIEIPYPTQTVILQK